MGRPPDKQLPWGAELKQHLLRTELRRGSKTKVKKEKGKRRRRSSRDPKRDISRLGRAPTGETEPVGTRTHVVPLLSDFLLLTFDFRGDL
jgi:hypothetical protein